MKNEKMFVCYNPTQMKFFHKRGLRYAIYGLHPKTHKDFWVFERDEKLNKVFDEWIEACKRRPTF